VLPRLVEMEAKYGSLTRGMLAGMRARKAAEEAKAAENEGMRLLQSLLSLRCGLVCSRWWMR
jgi:hypothetical protein